MLWWNVALVIAAPLLVWLAAGAPSDIEVPEFKGFNFKGGFSLPPAFLALLVALTFYHAAHLAESVRAGILSVSAGQTDATTAIRGSCGNAVSRAFSPNSPGGSADR